MLYVVSASGTVFGGQVINSNKGEALAGALNWHVGQIAYLRSVQRGLEHEVRQ